MLVTALFAPCTKVSAEAQGVNIDRVNRSMTTVTKSINNLMEILPVTEHEYVWNSGEITRSADEKEPGIMTYTCIEDPMFTMTGRFVAYQFTQGENSEWVTGNGSPLRVKAVRKPVNDSTMTHFRRVLVDGTEASEADYDLSEGSIIVALKPSFLKGLSSGGHTLTLEFDDGSIGTKFTISKEKDKTVSPGYKLPLTGIE